MGYIASADANGTDAILGASTAALNATYLQDAIETQRALISKVGASDGSGPLRGLEVYQGDLYAFRDNLAGTQGLMWKATSAGWVQQTLGNRVSFTLGTLEFEEGETLTQGGATATINRVVKQSGDWGTNDAAGYLVIGAVTGGPYAAGIATSASGSATLSGAEVANTIPAGGRYEFEIHNFFGSSETKRMYGVNGVGTAFEWDGTVFVPIITGNTVDTPSHISEFSEHLHLVFANGILQNSDTGTPYVWAGGGALEIGCGDDISGIVKERGGVLAIICRNRTLGLYGRNTVAAPYNLQVIDEEAGGIEWTIQRLGRTRWLDDRGLVSLAAVQEFGDFDSATFSQLIEPLLSSKKELATTSIIVKEKTQYRLYFSDGTAVVATFRDKRLSGFTTQYYFDSNGDGLPVRCTANGEGSNGSEILFFGSDDGYVYQMDKGTSFDGQPVPATIVLAYNHLKTPNYNKQFKKVSVDLAGALNASIQYSARLNYSGGRTPGTISKTDIISSGLTYWDEAAWNTFNWSSADVTVLEGRLDGVSQNIALQIFSSNTYVEPHTLFSVIYDFIYRKRVK